MATRRRLALSSMLGLAVAGCASGGGHYPSLLPREIERRDDLEPVRPAPPVVADPALDSRLADTAKALQAAANGFADSVARAQPAVSRAAASPAGSDAWIEAQRQLGDLDGARSITVGIEADLDRMAIDRSAAGLPPYPALEALRMRVRAEIEAESKKIDALQASLSKA